MDKGCDGGAEKPWVTHGGRLKICCSLNEAPAGGAIGCGGSRALAPADLLLAPADLLRGEMPRPPSGLKCVLGLAAMCGAGPPCSACANFIFCTAPARSLSTSSRSTSGMAAICWREYDRILTSCRTCATCVDGRARRSVGYQAGGWCMDRGVWIAYLGFSHGTRSALGTLDHANQRPNTVAKILIRLVSHQVAAGNRTAGLGREAARPARTSVDQGGDVVGVQCSRGRIAWTVQAIIAGFDCM